MPTENSGNASLSELYSASGLKRLADKMRRQPVVGRVREFLDDLRTDVNAAARERLPQVTAMAGRLARRVLGEGAVGQRAVINASGVIAPQHLHLPLCDAALAEINATATEYVERQPLLGAACETKVCQLLQALTGADAALVVNSHSAALQLVLSALAAKRDVVVARSQVAAIDGVPLTGIADAAQVRLREVGTASCASASDYAAVLDAQTAVVLQHLPGEFSFIGNHTCATLDELVELCGAKQTIVVQSLDLATLLDLSGHCGDCATLVGQSIVSGADVVVFGGERLMGGPPCGIIVGRRALLKTIAAQSALRSLTADRLTQAALQGTLEQYREPGVAERQIPLLQMLVVAEANLKNRAERLAPQLASLPAIAVARACERPAYVSASQVESQRLASWAVALQPAQGDADHLAQRLRELSPAVWGSVADGKLWLDLRGVVPRQDEQIVRAVQTLAGPGGSESSPQASPVSAVAE